MRRGLLYSIVSFTLILTVMVISLPSATVMAQDNLLTNGGMEQGSFGPYTGRGRPDLNVPAGWNIWLGQGSTEDGNFLNRGDKVFAFPHQGIGPEPAEGGTAMNLSGDFVQFNAAVFQSVGVAADNNVRAEVAVQLKSTGGSPQVRIGIDPNGGSDPNSPEIVWSGSIAPVDRWERIAVEATSTGDSVTVFLFATQGGPADLNRVYWDDAKLTLGGEGGSAEAAGDEGGGESPQAAPPSNIVPFVLPQGEGDDGSIIHTVQQGDTIDSIAVAYGITREQLMERNPNLQSIRFINIGQEIIIQEPVAEVTASRSERDPDATPIPGGVATEEPTDGETTTDSEDPVPIIINPDPKGLQAASDEETNELLDAVGSILGDGGNALPEDTMTDDMEETDTEMVDQMTEADEPTEVMAEATPAPTAVADAGVVVEADSLPSVDIAASTVAVCVSLFEDANQNRLREDSEILLPGGTVTLNSDGAEVASYDTDGTSEPHCFNQLDAGEYVAIVDAPEGYGLTTPNQLRLPLIAGSTLNIEFGAAPGLEAVAIPQDSGADLGNSADDVLPAESTTILDDIYEVSGIAVVVLAGVVVVSGVGATIILRRG